MKTVRALFLALCTAVAATAADSPIEFHGVMTGGGPTQLSLIDKASGTTRWVEVGKTFLGYTVKSYDSEKETATLAKDGREFQIRLSSSKVLDAPSESVAVAAPPAASATNERLTYEKARTIFNNLKQIAAARDQFLLEKGARSVTVDELVGPTKYIKQLKPEAGEDYNVINLAIGIHAPLLVTTASGETIVYDQGGRSSSFRELKPGETLAQIALTTGTPVSQLTVMNNITDPTRLQSGQLLRVK